ncbi:M15 family metallopeptidase [Bacteroides sp. 224]|uniref:M15 family metallopeptidase n=1 Tax=Bacteroides sp. 224 TaxID=2302936 RepID=UPI0013D34ED9|nr:M15 family metallopeptidase [Bacteroides sp. 224]NDV63708.1 D-alanyl-D-alanine dipeptidase [Bacteroides sp. 224]
MRIIIALLTLFSSVCFAQNTYIKPVKPKSDTALRFDSLGLVNVAELDSTIAIQLIYATANNFTGEVLYDDLTEAYLHPDAAEALVAAQRFLKEQYPAFNLVIYDATRPMSAQRKMWNLVKGTSKSIYVSNPARGGGLHNYGLAVDVSILDSLGLPLPMGTEFDHLGYESHITQEDVLVRNKIITPEEKKNRELLRRVMRKAGYRALNSEWWHFNKYSRDEAKKRFKVID